MKYYFLSDAHLGLRTIKDAATHQKKLIEWMRFVATDASEVFLLGDIFDFWFEFPNRIPPGFDDVLQEMKALSDKGIKVHFFCGNHDQWTFGYLERECGVIVHRQEYETVLCGKKFFMHHGHGLGENNRFTKILNRIFESDICRWLFRHLMPPSLAWKLGYAWSKKNRLKHSLYDNKFLGENVESQIVFAKKYSERHKDVDYIVMGHRHMEVNIMLATGAQVMILGDFISLFSYATFDGEILAMETFE